MSSGGICLHLLVLVFLGISATTISALECYVAEGLPNMRPISERTQVCGPDETSCFEYEGSPHMPPVFRLVYYAGCGKREQCDYNVNFGNCTVCDTDKCNTGLIQSIRSSNRLCYSYFSSYDSIGVSDHSTASVICPSGIGDCFQVHFPAGSAYSAWTQFTGGCGSAKAGCTRQFSHTMCTVCSENFCNSPHLPNFGTLAAGDEAYMVGEASGIGPTGAVTVLLALALAIGAAAL